MSKDGQSRLHDGRFISLMTYKCVYYGKFAYLLECWGIAERSWINSEFLRILNTNPSTQ